MVQPIAKTQPIPINAAPVRMAKKPHSDKKIKHGLHWLNNDMV
jgi:hypothetical protein